jgi:hypothetical protein
MVFSYREPLSQKSACKRNLAVAQLLASLEKGGVSAQMDASQVVCGEYSGPKTDSVSVAARMLVVLLSECKLGILK